MALAEVVFLLFLRTSFNRTFRDGARLEILGFAKIPLVGKAFRKSTASTRNCFVILLARAGSGSAPGVEGRAVMGQAVRRGRIHCLRRPRPEPAHSSQQVSRVHCRVRD